MTVSWFAFNTGSPPVPYRCNGKPSSKQLHSPVVCSEWEVSGGPWESLWPRNLAVLSTVISICVLYDAQVPESPTSKPLQAADNLSSQ